MPMVDIMQYNDVEDVFARRYPIEEIVKSGLVIDIFEAGCYTLSAANIPLLNKLIYLPFGRISTVSA